MMRDPVTAVTGITYDRESIEKWLSTANSTVCPVTKQPLPRNSDLTPNHTLRRLIQAWCTGNASKGVDRIPTPKSPPNKSFFLGLIRDLDISEDLDLTKLKKLEDLAKESENNRKGMADAGAIKAISLFIIKLFKESKVSGVGEALNILNLIWAPSSETTALVNENKTIIEAVTWVFHCSIDNHVMVKSTAISVLKMIVGVANSSLLERLKPEFFGGIMRILKEKISPQATKSALRVLIEVCPWGMNRMKIVESDAVFHLIELELAGSPDKKTTELIFCLLAHLCSCADGRAKFLRHAGSIAMVSKRVLRVSPATDDQAVHILDLISKFSATNDVVLEMLRVGAVSKVCMVLQADCAPYLKKKAREILRLHKNVWNNSPCIQIYLLTRYPR
ncbi:U-box domain [Dillenia turbinata]|uniref:U-box domain-containing protein n=1 Tax=Dillenia turbinata TaxID=194707 RepID=A0AAN8VAH3_9MAGN